MSSQRTRYQKQKCCDIKFDLFYIPQDQEKTQSVSFQPFSPTHSSEQEEEASHIKINPL